MENLYQIENLLYHYSNQRKHSWSIFGKKEEKEVEEKVAKEFQLGPLDLNIPKGKLTAILGRSGSGKTTLLSIIGLLRQPTDGQVKINIGDGVDIKGLWGKNKALEGFRSSHLGFALQKGELLPHLSLFENASLVSTYLDKEESQVVTHIDQYFKALYTQEDTKEESLERVKHQKPANVSQGQYQRGAIVRALANNPSIILADEPTGNLDIHAGAQTMAIFRDIVKSNPEKSVIVVTHDRKLAVDFADVIIILKEGKVKASYFRREEQTNWLRIDENSQESVLQDVREEIEAEADDLMSSIGKDLD